jgi:hypothetical protein
MVPGVFPDVLARESLDDRAEVFAGVGVFVPEIDYSLSRGLRAVGVPDDFDDRPVGFVVRLMLHD